MSEAPAHGRNGRVLVVCTGNVCRSPFVERLLRASLASTGLEVSSAGTGALVGEPIEPRVAQHLLAQGGDPAGFRARQLTPALVAQADLVLTATRRHRGEVVVTHPKAMRYTFTLGDFAHLAASLGPSLAEASPEGQAPSPGTESWVQHVRELVANQRGLVPPLEEDVVDLVDPYRQDDAVVAEMVEQVLVMLPALVRTLGGQPA